MRYKAVPLLATLAVATLALTSCASGASSEETLDPKADITKQKLVVSVWADYYPEDLAETFESGTKNDFARIEQEGWVILRTSAT